MGGGSVKSGTHSHGTTHKYGNKKHTGTVNSGYVGSNSGPNIVVNPKGEVFVWVGGTWKKVVNG